MEAKNENVSMKPSANRVADELVGWAAKEVKDLEIFGDVILKQKHYAAEKLKYFETIRIKYAGTKNPEEKRYLNILKDIMPELKKLAMPLKIQRILYDLRKVVLHGVKLFVDAAKQVGESIAIYQERKRDEAVKKSIEKDVERSKKIAMYNETVRPLLNKNKEEIAGPDRHLRGNIVESERGKDEKVRKDFDIDYPLLPKKNNPKGQSVAASDDALLPKNHEGTKKGISF